MGLHPYPSSVKAPSLAQREDKFNYVGAVPDKDAGAVYDLTGSRGAHEGRTYRRGWSRPRPPISHSYEILPKALMDTQ